MPKINNKYLVNSMASNTDRAFIYFYGWSYPHNLSNFLVCQQTMKNLWVYFFKSNFDEQAKHDKEPQGVYF